MRSFCPYCGKLTLSEEKQQKLKPNEKAKKARDAKKCSYCNETIERVKLEKPSIFLVGKKRLSPIEIRERLVKISDAELKKIGIATQSCRPEWAIISLLLVPSVTVRPSITLESGERSEDDLTHKLSDIIRANQRLWENLNAGAPEVIIEDLWDLLQYHITTFFDNTISRIPPARHRSGQPLKTITERIKGKEGRIRHNLAGKRVNYSARTVVSPDPYIKIDEIGIPIDISKIISVAEKVTSTNIEEMKELIKKGSEYPGANYVVRSDGKRKKITDELKEDLCNELEPGYMIERHLRDGDIVLFNRAPTLHKQSLMAHYVKVLPGRTFRIHPAAATPYNADFDGDECNIHSPQTEEARVEAKILLNITNNIISSKNNVNLIGTSSDAVTGAYILASDTFDKAEADQLLFSAGIINSSKTKKISGKELYSQILPRGSKIEIPDEILSENALGEDGGVIVKMIDQEFGKESAVDSVYKAFLLGANYLSRRGYSLSLEDLNVSEKVKAMSDKIIVEAERKTAEIIEQYNSGKLELLPGKTLEETRENKIMHILNEVRTETGKIVKAHFPVDGAVNKMITPGAAGSMLNITQIGCCVGQQSLWNRRINFGYKERTLSFYKKGDLNPESRGFIKSSAYSGLNPQEFFFSSITGRDSMMDTALRTPKSGYLYRRLVSALQDLKVEYDGTVRDASGNIVEFKFGDDGKDVSKLHLKENKISSGEAVGVVTAQSFGEASTQMVLNVFHHAGVSQVQITQGLPRLIEVLDARKQPSTPFMEAYLDKEHNNENDAKVIAEKVKEVKLKEIIQEIRIDFANKKIYIELDNKGLKMVHAGAQKISERLSESGVDVKVNANTLNVNVKDLEYKAIYKLKQKLKETIISGIKGISQVVVVLREKDYVILTSGGNLAELITFKGINKNKVYSNDIHDVAKVFGIEAARQAIITELQKVLDGQGLSINERHLKLIADAMTSSGVIKGVTRMGIISQKASILARATFETPDKQFIAATIQGAKDDLNSVIENILLNQPIPVGTGLPGLLVEVTGPLVNRELEKEK